MRIIAGRFRGHGLASPEGHLTRPSTARTRESLFSLVDARIYLDGAEVLDLFSGTGALGLEAISRGAALVTFVEQEREVLDYARRNAQKLGVEDQCIFICGDAVEYLRRYSGPDLDLIMADPPYKLDAMRDLPDLAIPHLDTDGVLTLEHSTHDWFDEHPHLMTSRAYGRTIVSLFRPPLPPSASTAEDPVEDPADDAAADDAMPEGEVVAEPASGDPIVSPPDVPAPDAAASDAAASDAPASDAPAPDAPATDPAAPSS